MLHDNEKYDRFLDALADVPALPEGLDDQILRHRQKTVTLYRFWKPAVAAMLVLAGTFSMRALAPQPVPSAATVTIEMDEYFSYLWEEEEDLLIFELDENEML